MFDPPLLFVILVILSPALFVDALLICVKPTASAGELPELLSSNVSVLVLSTAGALIAAS